MSSSARAAALAIASCFLLVGKVCSQTPFSFFSYIGEEFLKENLPNEVSGLDIAPDRSHLVAVSDDGKLFFLNLNDYSSGHAMVDLSDDVIIGGRSDFEGIAIDTGAWDPIDMRAYVVHEGSHDDEPYLFEIKYGYGENGYFSATVVDRKSLVSAIPCLEGSNGIESFGLKTKSSLADPAVFFVGIQDTGNIYGITSEGLSNGPDSCYDSGLGVEDITSTTYDGSYLWSFIDREDMIAVVDPRRDCTLAIYDAMLPENEEGLAFDFENGLVYVVSEEGGGDIPSHVSVYNFTYPDDLGECLNEGARSCSGFSVCGATPSSNGLESSSTSSTLYPTAFPTMVPTSFPTAYPTSYPTLYPTAYPNALPTSSPTYFTINFSGYDMGDGGESSSSSSSSSSSESILYDTENEDDDFSFSSFFFGASDDEFDNEDLTSSPTHMPTCGYDKGDGGEFGSSSSSSSSSESSSYDIENEDDDFSFSSFFFGASDDEFDDEDLTSSPTYMPTLYPT